MPSLTKVQTGFLEPQGAFTLDPGTASAPGLKFSTSAATGMFSPSAGVLGFSTGSTQNALTILANGNVGVGLNNPGVLFESATFGVGGATVARFRRNNNADQHVFDISVNPDTDTVKLISTGSANGSITLGTLAIDALTTTNSGNVGIGTTNPEHKFSVLGTADRFSELLGNTIRVRIAASEGGWNSLIGFAANSGTFLGGLSAWGNIQDMSYLNLGVGTSPNSLTIHSSGNVGIGTANPQAPLHLYGSSTTQLIQDSSGIIKFVTSGGTNYIQSAATPTTGSSADLRFTSFNASTTYAVLTATGNVGIGTTNPDVKFYVWNGQTTLSGRAKANTGTTLRLTTTDSSNRMELLFDHFANNFWRIQAVEQEVGYRSLVLQNDGGNVGIGTTNPTDIFDVYKDQNASTAFYFRNPNSGSSARSRLIVSSDTGTGNISIGQHSSNYAGASNQGWLWTSGASTPLILGTIGTERVRIDTSGNVGIGTTNPTSKLHVQGNTYISGALTAESYGYARIFDYDAPASPDGTGYVWIRASMGGFNNGGDIVKFSLSRSINENSNNPYGGPSLDVTGVYSREWHGGQEFFTATYGYHGNTPGSGWILNAGPRDLGGGGCWFYLRLYAGVRYYFRYPMSSGYISPTWEQTTDPTSVPELQLGVNILGNFGQLKVSNGIIAGGNVGIGTTNPSVKFHVLGGNTVSRIESSTTYVDLQLSNSVSSQAYIQYNNQTLNFFAASASTPSLSITGGSPGNVGIGTTNPQTKLHVNGNIIGRVADGTGILYTTYGALSSSKVTSYSNNLLGYNLRGWVSSVDGGVGNNNFYSMYTAPYGFSGIEQAYGGHINFYTCDTQYQSTTLNTTVTPRLAAAINPGGILDAKYGVVAPMGWAYQNTYTIDSTWSSGWQTIIPSGICSFGTYVVSLYWNYAEIPGAGLPYYITAATIFTAVPSTNGTGTENAVALLSATHTGGSGVYLQVRTIAFTSGNTGLQVNIVNYTAVSGTIFSVYVQKIGY